jgi:DNA-binding transcriptional regulator WhiA
VKLPDKITTDLAYIAGYHFGDGYLEDSNKTIHRKGKADYEITYADENGDMIQIIVSMFQRLFNVKPKVSKRGNMFVARLYSKIVHAFLQYVLKLQIGKKQTERIPDYIHEDLELLRHFIRGFFDAEGYIYYDKYNKKVRLGVTNSNMPLLHEMKDNLLNAFNIRILGPYKKHKQECWDLKIFKICDIKEFIAKIGFNHPRKRNFLRTPLLAEIDSEMKKEWMSCHFGYQR